MISSKFFHGRIDLQDEEEEEENSLNIFSFFSCRTGVNVMNLDRCVEFVSLEILFVFCLSLIIESGIGCERDDVENADSTVRINDGSLEVNVDRTVVDN